MSLKAVHIAFIVLAILLAAGLGLWAVRDHSSSGSIANLSLGAASFTAAVALTAYLFWFFRKMKKVTTL